MNLKLLYITNNVDIAKIAESSGVDRIFIDLETLGKDKRQRGRDTVKSVHSIADIASIKNVLSAAQLLVRVNPINPNSKTEIEAVIKAGAEIIMLPMIKTVEEVSTLVSLVRGRAKLCMLIETYESVLVIDDILKTAPKAEYFIGLNDLHLSYGHAFMFEPLADGTVERLINKFRFAGVTQYGFGGIARVGEDAILSAESIITEHHRLNSTMVILSRSFCNALKAESLDEIRDLMESGVKNIRKLEEKLADYSPVQYEENRRAVISAVSSIKCKIKSY